MSPRSKGAAAGRAMLMQGLVTQGGLAVVLLLLAFFSRHQPRMMYGMLWSLIVPVSVTAAFLRAHERSRRADARPGTERAEAKRALTLLGFVVLVWLVGLALLLIF